MMRECEHEQLTTSVKSSFCESKSIISSFAGGETRETDSRDIDSS